MLGESQRLRQITEMTERMKGYRRGIKGLWDALTGRTAALRRQHEAEREDALARDRKEHQSLVNRQLIDRRGLQTLIVAQKRRHENEVSELISNPNLELVGPAKFEEDVTRKSMRRSQQQRFSP